MVKIPWFAFRVAREIIAGKNHVDFPFSAIRSVFDYDVFFFFFFFLSFFITKTYLYNSDPLKPHFYIVKLGFTGVYIIFFISAQKHRLRVLVRTA